MNLWIIGPIALYAAWVAWSAYQVWRNDDASTGEKWARGTTSQYTRWPIFFTMAATFVGPTYSLGIVDRTFTFSAVYVLIYCMAVIHIALTGQYLVPVIKNSELRTASTLGDVVVHFYGAPGTILLGVVVFLQYVAFTAVLALGGAIVLELVFGIEQYVGVVAVAVFVGAYTYFSGLAGVLKTDKVQFGFLALLGLIALYVGSVGLSGAGQVSPADIWGFPPEQLSLVAFAGLMVGFLLGEAFQPFYMTRAFIGRDAEEVRKGFWYTAAFGVLWFSALGFVGVALHGLFASAPPDSGLLIAAAQNVLGQSIWGQILFGFLAAGVLGVVMSTLDSVLNSGSVALARDTIGTWLGHDDAQQLRFSKMAVVVMALAGATLASTGSDLVDLLFIGYSIWVPTVVAPIAYALIWKRTKGYGRSFVVSVGFGVAAYFLCDAFLAEYFPPIAAGLLANILALLVSEEVLTPVKIRAVSCDSAERPA